MHAALTAAEIPFIDPVRPLDNKHLANHFLPYEWPEGVDRLKNPEQLVYVRSPWPWAVSLYEYNRRTGRELIMAPGDDFDYFCQKLPYWPGDWIPGTGNMYVYKMEYMAGSLPSFGRRFGIMLSERHENVSPRYDYRQYYTTKLADFVRDRNHYLVEQLAYEFE